MMEVCVDFYDIDNLRVADTGMSAWECTGRALSLE